MFTGIIEATGRISAINVNSQGARVVVQSNTLDMGDVRLGDSIATNGVCLTVVAFDSQSFSADASSETLARTGFTDYRVGTAVNLEKAMLASTRFGGHMVSGHVDALTQVLSIEDKGNSIDYWLAMPADLAPYIAEKGSVTIDGVSLTVNGLAEDSFRITIVPHTRQETIIKSYQPGTRVNLEVDLIARYLERLLLARSGKGEAASESKPSGITEALLKKSGFLS
ncbi:riboflavin synthase [Thalassomonas viridans]|uniref:Riboflavin synthase n=1 Tax=Thalassomonas viridans TaxID=137584 RepID=A0AAF0CAF7_9GAMM|nr:riboflavin synthase [Thalassomonas viridans]WDE06466.1 riboflavin synthase [Thalassomonas viridans]